MNQHYVPIFLDPLSPSLQTRPDGRERGRAPPGHRPCPFQERRRHGQLRGFSDPVFDLRQRQPLPPGHQPQGRLRGLSVQAAYWRGRPCLQALRPSCGRPEGLCEVLYRPYIDIPENRVFLCLLSYIRFTLASLAGLSD